VTKARTFLLIDLFILAAFIVSAVSGLVFFIPARWVDATSSTVPTFLGADFRIWVDIHTYCGLAMMAGCLTHICLHWRWILRTAGGAMPWSRRHKNGSAASDQVPCP
jgi:cytochrome b subunit of formate dehydrogenase